MQVYVDGGEECRAELLLLLFLGSLTQEYLQNNAISWP